ncbi:hypothetical protein FIBSPDRAFT_62175 [Athelia psychrophila]|uniref:Uncharacterized protein n=1 Tax=Athelia psychrophila TaxID=1759441 RepID=A0A166F1Z5_9AGAM|nr:hypothetical protein FIBSPDRAFT_62175 [Fibularhizoctonia sp. CBS 109695]
MLTSAANTPFIPPLPSPGGRSIRPPVVPNPEVNEPSWAREPMNMANYPTQYPGMGTPYVSAYSNLAPSGYGGGGGQQFTPFIPPSADLHPAPSMGGGHHSTPSMGGGHHISPSMGGGQQIPGSYFAAPRGLPPQTPHHGGGQLSADYTGYPQGPPPPGNPYAQGPPPGNPYAQGPPPGNPYAAAGTPWQTSVPMPGGFPPQTPYSQPMHPQDPRAQAHMMAPPGTGYSMFQQPLPGQYGGGGQHPAAAAGWGGYPQTPAMGMGFGMGGMGAGMGGMGAMPGGPQWGAPPPAATPWHGPSGQLPPAAAGPPPGARPAAMGGSGPRGHASEGWDLVGTDYDRFSADAQSA